MTNLLTGIAVYYAIGLFVSAAVLALDWRHFTRFLKKAGTPWPPLLEAAVMIQSLAWVWPLTVVLVTCYFSLWPDPEEGEGTSHAGGERDKM